MTDDPIDVRLHLLTERISELPEAHRKRMMQLVGEAKARHEQIKTSTAEARDALADWRLRFKYRLFDAEARAREAREE